MNRHAHQILVLLSALGVAGPARADEGEWRIGGTGGGIVMTARTGGAEGVGLGLRAGGRIGYGLADVVEVSLVGGYANASDVRFNAASLAGQTGALYADVSQASLGVELRLTPGLSLSRAFERTGPYVALSVGGALEARASQQIFNATGLLLADVDDDIQAAPFVGASVGVEHRLGDHFFLSGELGLSVGRDQRFIGLMAEAAWAWY